MAFFFLSFFIAVVRRHPSSSLALFSSVFTSFFLSLFQFVHVTWRRTLNKRTAANFVLVRQRWTKRYQKPCPYSMFNVHAVAKIIQLPTEKMRFIHVILLFARTALFHDCILFVLLLFRRKHQSENAKTYIYLWEKTK